MWFDFGSILEASLVKSHKSNFASKKCFKKGVPPESNRTLFHGPEAAPLACALFEQETTV